MDRLRLENVDSRYGAPMGRTEWRPEDPKADGKLQLAYVKFPWRDAYDYGGAYWGLPANLWHAEGWMACDAHKHSPRAVDQDVKGKCIVRFFCRAPSREEAKEQIRIRFPNVRFYR